MKRYPITGLRVISRGEGASILNYLCLSLKCFTFYLSIFYDFSSHWVAWYTLTEDSLESYIFYDSTALLFGLQHRLQMRYLTEVLNPCKCVSIRWSEGIEPFIHFLPVLD